MWSAAADSSWLNTDVSGYELSSWSAPSASRLPPGEVAAGRPFSVPPPTLPLSAKPDRDLTVPDPDLREPDLTVQSHFGTDPFKLSDRSESESCAAASRVAAYCLARRSSSGVGRALRMNRCRSSSFADGRASGSFTRHWAMNSLKGRL